MTRARPPQRAAQLAMDVEDPHAAAEQVARDHDDQRLALEHFFAACRQVCRELGYERCANELDAIWSKVGRGVSASTLKATLAPNGERNYFRFEWAIWFAQQSEEVADLLLEIAGRGKPEKTPEEELRDLKELMRRELGATGNKLIRKAAAPR